VWLPQNCPLKGRVVMEGANAQQSGHLRGVKGAGGGGGIAAGERSPHPTETKQRGPSINPQTAPAPTSLASPARAPPLSCRKRPRLFTDLAANGDLLQNGDCSVG
jgi:hypothetical protein